MKINREKLNLELARKCFSLSDLKDEANIGRSTMTKILNGNLHLQPKTLGKIARALEIDPEKIIER